jgi:hypothetical protein
MIKRNLKPVLGIFLLSVWLIAACGWKPEVSAVPLTAPWSTMNLPVKENAVVWKSQPNIFSAVHKEDKKTILKNYTEALKAQGWQVGKFDDSGERYVVNMTKGADAIEMQIYDFSNTGVIIEKK